MNETFFYAIKFCPRKTAAILLDIYVIYENEQTYIRFYVYDILISYKKKPKDIFIVYIIKYR
jgi:hypothetical protein